MIRNTRPMFGTNGSNGNNHRFFNPQNQFTDGNNWTGNRGNFNYRPPGPPPDFFQAPPPLMSQGFNNNYTGGVRPQQFQRQHSGPLATQRPPFQQVQQKPTKENWNNRNNSQSQAPFPQKQQNRPNWNNRNNTQGGGVKRDGGVKREGSNDQRPKKKQKKPRVDKRDLPENNKFVCEPCDRGYKDENAFKLHCEKHEKCKEEGCSYVAAPKLVQLHYQWQHRTGLAKKIWQLESKEDIEKWREERKKNYPTQANIDRKTQVSQERTDRGEVIETRTFGKMRGSNRNCNRAKNFLEKANAELKAAETEAAASGGQAENLAGKEGKKRRRQRNRRKGKQLANEGVAEVEKTADCKKPVEESTDEKQPSSSEESDSDGDPVQITAVTKVTEEEVDPLSVIVIGDDSSSDEETSSKLKKSENAEKTQESPKTMHTTKPVETGTQTPIPTIIEDLKSPLFSKITSKAWIQNFPKTTYDIKSIPNSAPIVTTNPTALEYQTTRSPTAMGGMGALGSLAAMYGDGSSSSDSETSDEEEEECAQQQGEQSSSKAGSINVATRMEVDQVKDHSQDIATNITTPNHGKSPNISKTMDNVNVKVEIKTEKMDTQCTQNESKAGQNETKSGQNESKTCAEIENLRQNETESKEKTENCEKANKSSEAISDEMDSQNPECTKSENPDLSKKSSNKRKNKRNTFKQRPAMSKKRLTLLQKLLAPDIRHERNVVMQCIRHIVKTDFFGLKVAGQLKVKGEKAQQKIEEVDDELWEGEGVL